MLEKTCCVIDCGDIPADKLDYVKRELEREVGQALEDGYRTFLSEFAEGAGMLFAGCVNEQRQHPDIYLEALLPNPQHCKRFDHDSWELLSKCGGIKVLCEKCQQDYPLSVTRYLVEQSSRVIAVYNGQTRYGNLFAMDYARTMERDLRIIQL